MFSTVILASQGSTTKHIKNHHTEIRMTEVAAHSWPHIPRALPLKPLRLYWELKQLNAIVRLLMLHLVELYHLFSSFSESFRDYQRVFCGWGCCYS